ncbi:MAG: hypothetical protein ACREQ7_23630 [Candidatus Binatia bacterium]
METTLVWISIFAGAAIGLLGLFLVASEKELKRKRREVEALSAKLNDLPEANGDFTSADQENVATGLSAELTARNKELSKQVTELTIQLQGSQNRIRELEEAALRLSNMETEMSQMRGSHQRLLEENLHFKNQLLESEQTLRNVSVGGPEMAERYSQMEAQIAGLKDELGKSLARVQELESQQQLAEFEAGQNSLLENQSLQARIRELETELAGEKEKITDLNLTQSRLSEMERTSLVMDQENKRLQEETSRCREQLRESEETRHRLGLAVQQLDQLDLKHAALSQQHGEIQGEMAALRKLLSAGPEGPLQLELSDDPFRSAGHPFGLHAAEYHASSSNDESDNTFTRHRDDLNKSTEASAPETPRRIEAAIEAPHPSNAGTPPNGKQSYKTLVVIIPILLIAGTVVAGLFQKQSMEPDAFVIATSTHGADSVREADPQPDVPKAVAVADGSSAEEASLPTEEKRTDAQTYAAARHGKEAQVTTVAATSVPSNARVNEPIGTKAQTVSSKAGREEAKPSLRAWGAYEIIRHTQVYKEPTENSQPLAKLDPGTQLNVVSARDGWLEIRSKNGRPPGFIKSDTAARMSKN